MMAPYTGQTAPRRALPLDQTVKWLPLDDAYYLLAEVMTAARALPLVVMQEALLQVEAHASSEVYGSTCGVLCGAPYRESRSDEIYLLVEGIERATLVNRDGDPAASLAADLSRAIASAERAGRTVVGWYCFDVALSQKIPTTHAGIHRSLFPDPWKVALLRDGSDGEGSGAFVRVEPTEGRAFPVPFLELIPRKRARKRGPRYTSIQWSNYSAESTVVPLPVQEFRDVSPPPPSFPGPTPVKRERSERARRPGLFGGAFGDRTPHAVPRRPMEARRGPQPWGGKSPLVKGAAGIMVVLAVSFFMARGDAASRPTSLASESGELATPTSAATTAGAAQGAAGGAGREIGGFTPEERSRAWSALAQIATLRGELAARLDTLDGALLAARGASDRTVPCARAAALYESALGDRAKITAARKELAQLVGPTPMAGVDSLTDRAAAMQPLLTSSCR